MYRDIFSYDFNYNNNIYIYIKTILYMSMHAVQIRRLDRQIRYCSMYVGMNVCM